MTPERHPTPKTLVVGPLDHLEPPLDTQGLQRRSVSDTDEALAALEEEHVDCLLTAYDTVPLSGVELAATVFDQYGIPGVVVGDAPAAATEVPGVSAVVDPSDPEHVVRALQGALRPDDPEVLSAKTVAALEQLYEVDRETHALDDWLSEVLSIGCQRLGVPYGYMTRVEDGVRHIVGSVGDHDALRAGTTAPLEETYCQRTVQTDTLVGDSDLTDAEWVSDDAFDRFGFSCYLGSRYELADGTVGTICFAGDEARPSSFSADERTFVTLVKHWVQHELQRHDRQSELRLKDRVIDEVGLGVTITDPSRPDNPLVYVNDGFEEITGYDREEVLGRNCRFLQGENTDPETVSQMREAIDAGREVSVELRNYRKDGTEFWKQLEIYPVTEDGEIVNFVGFQQDITEQKARKQELETYETAVQTAVDGIFRLDAENRFVMVNDAICEMTGFDRDALIGEPAARLLPEGDDALRGIQNIREALRGAETEDITLEVTVRRADGTTFPGEFRARVLGDDGSFRGTVVVLRDITADKVYEHTLAELNAVSRRLLSAESYQEIGDAVAAAADEILDIEVVGVYRFDEQANVLRPESIPDSATALVGDPPRFGPGDGIAWEVFVTGERRLYDDVTTSPDVHNPETDIRSELLLPIGDHGVLICGSTEAAAYDDQTVELADILVANAEAAYDRVAREERIRERDRERKRQNRRLRQLDDVNERVRRISHDLVGATTREEIERVVCDRLAENSEYDFVWVGGMDAIGTAVTPRQLSGTRRGYLDAVSLSGDDTDPEPTIRAASERAPVVRNRVADDLRSGTWQREALSREYLSVASFPLVHRGVPYGTVSVYANTTDAFDDETTTVLGELADTVAHAIATVEQRRALLSDERVELVFGLDTQPTVLFELAAKLDGPVELQRIVPSTDESNVGFGTVGETSETAFIEACRETHGITDCRILGTEDDDLRVEIQVEGATVVDPLADHGGSFGRFKLDGDRGQLAVTFPQSATVNEFISFYTDRYPGTELLARREPNRDYSQAEDQDLLEDLTDRQREVLEVAHELGFFGWPRDKTVEEIAEDLDIAGPTFLEHLRRAEAKLMDRLL